MPKTSVIIGPAYPYRGGQALVETYMHQTLTQVGYENHTVTFSLLYPSVFFPGKTQYDESQTHFAGNRNTIYRIINSVNPLSWIRAARKVRALQPSVVVMVWWMPFFGPAYSVMAWLIKRWTGAQVFFLVENYISHENRWFDRFFSKITLNQADAFICQSKYIHDAIARNHPGKPVHEVTLSVFDCFDLHRYTAQTAKAELGINTRRVVLFFGLIRPYKGLDQLIRAFPALLEHYPDTTLLAVGEAYESFEKYTELVREHGLENHVRLLNLFVPNEAVEPYFKAADLICLPYYSATQSGILMMAYGFKKPVVVTDVGGLAELVAEGLTGAVIPDNSPENIVWGIRKIFDNTGGADFEKEIEKISQNLGYQKLKTIFDPESK